MVPVFDYPMSTPSGHAAFLDPEVNAIVKKVLNEWGKFLLVSEIRTLAIEIPQGLSSTHGLFRPSGKHTLIGLSNSQDLQTPESAKVLGKDKHGWFGETATKDVEIVANKAGNTDLKFHDMFVCDPSKEYHGFKSWDGKSLAQADLCRAKT